VAVKAEGAFGVLKVHDPIHDPVGTPFAVTLERTYTVDSVEIVKIPSGRYECTRDYYHAGEYVTYEIHVPAHARMLFHVGNRERDSEGCVLVGESFHDFGDTPGIGSSRRGFREFMERTGGRSRFLLEVVG
jgi:hypothetical protein